jgi:spore coat polysaccharide biosynthesis predicted glycosyltransferase SpsG
VSDLYENLAVSPERQLSGIQNAILAPQFESLRHPAEFRTRLETILLVFGGTDPSHLTERTLAALAQINCEARVLVVAGPGMKRDVSLADYGLQGEILRNVGYMPGLMRRADLAISSAGRTVTELLSSGVPVLCMCQNEKELTHTHAAARYGVINLGLGALIGTETLAAHVSRVIASDTLRAVLRQRADHELRGRSNARIIGRIMEQLDWKAP